MTGECVAGEQRGVHREDQRADGNTERSSRPERSPDVVPEKKENQQREVQQVAMQILENQWECCLAAILSAPSFSDGAAGRMERKGAVVRLAVVVAGQTKSARRPEDQDRRREPLRQHGPVAEV